ncbi:hypothetical protein [Paenibacillus sp. MMS20-IR301]|uniref:hypothetical protein n=1 Tax=Paenibacillus sp. MMS20-IR301 TaxID=2895946 RepID=UPI0028F109D1|nr:hypothetical protein [Paenibacillus sp. MMS20-IR301]WNS43936.1 hypothetical protein LOS79_01330 [Paenibacillus sp. MMS20-IR301]
MEQNKRLTALAIILFSGGLLAASALLVPGIVNNSVAAKNGPAAVNRTGVHLTGGTIPVLKVEAPAPVSTVSADLLDGMTEEEIRGIYELLNKPGNEPQMVGREMSEAEGKRSLVLSDKYVYDGLRPEQPLPLKAGQAEFYLELETHTLYFPERELTDEELLQMIDWSYRTMFIASRYNNADHVTVPPLPQKFSKAEIKQRAAESVRKLFDADVSKLETTVMLHEPGYGIPSFWSVHSAPYKSNTLRGQGKEYWQYDVMIDPETGTMIDTTAANVALKRTPIDAAAAAAVLKDSRWIARAKQIITDKQGETRAIVKASITGQDVNNKRGMVAVKLVLEDGSSYTAELRYPDQTLRCLIYEAAGEAE